MDEETPRRFQADGHVILPSFLDASTLGAVEDEIASLGVRDPASFDEGHFFLAPVSYTHLTLPTSDLE